MTMASPQSETRQRRLCSVIARDEGHDPIGTAWAVERMLVVELPLPWPEDFFAARAFPAGLGETLIALWDEHPNTGLLAIAQDRDYSRPDWTRVIDFRYPAPPRAAASRAEYLVPNDRVGEFVAGLFVDDPAALAIAGIESVSFTGRDLLVCTHGTVDACCAVFGYPLYRDLRRIAKAAGGECRVWRSTHFGGHRFAPTVLDFPEGRCWGFLDPELGESLILRRGEASELYGSYRGWAGYEEPKAQVLEREALVREGWAWTTWPQGCEVLEEDERGSMLLRLTAYPPSNSPIAYEGLVEVTGSAEIMHSTDGEIYEEPVLKARDVRRVVWREPR
jgi:hypothetical protein